MALPFLYKPAFAVIGRRCKEGSVAPKLEEVFYVKTLTNKEAYVLYCYCIIYSRLRFLFFVQLPLIHLQHL